MNSQTKSLKLKFNNIETSWRRNNLKYPNTHNLLAVWSQSFLIKTIISNKDQKK
jgi:hypothetical protein